MSLYERAKKIVRSHVSPVKENFAHRPSVNELRTAIQTIDTCRQAGLVTDDTAESMLQELNTALSINLSRSELSTTERVLKAYGLDGRLGVDQLAEQINGFDKAKRLSVAKRNSPRLSRRQFLAGASATAAMGTMAWTYNSNPNLLPKLNFLQEPRIDTITSTPSSPSSDGWVIYRPDKRNDFYYKKSKYYGRVINENTDTFMQITRPDEEVVNTGIAVSFSRGSDSYNPLVTFSVYDQDKPIGKFRLEDKNSWKNIDVSTIALEDLSTTSKYYLFFEYHYLQLPHNQVRKVLDAYYMNRLPV